MAIVCGTDFSINSRAAVRAAAALSFRLGEEDLWVVHVLDPSLPEGMDSAQLDTLKNQTTQRLTEETQEACVGFKLSNVHSVVLVGAAAETLTKFALEKEASLLLVDSRGHGASPLYRLGGTSERVAILSQVPVVVVRDAAPFVAWATGERSLSVVVGLDFTASSDPAVRLAKRLRRAGPCDLVFAHIHYWYDATARYGLGAPSSRSLRDADLQTQALLTRDLSARVGELPGEGTVTFLPKAGLGRVGDHVLEVAEAEKADLVVVGTHRRSGARRLLSVSSVVLHFGHASVACVPPEQVPRFEAHSIRRVLIPTDLSMFSNHAIPYGYSLLADHAGEVHLLHVVSGDPTSSPDQDAELVRQLRALVPEWAVERGIVTRTEVVHRKEVARAIHVTAARTAADAICIASHGRSGILRAVMGSTAEEVIRESSIPVLVIRPIP